jgi:hypothetical protein
MKEWDVQKKIAAEYLVFTGRNGASSFTVLYQAFLAMVM